LLRSFWLWLESLDASFGPDELTMSPAEKQLREGPDELTVSLAEERLREALRSEHRPIPFVGSGLSRAATGKDVAGWKGLLINGIAACEEANPALAKRNWGEPLKEMLKQGDLSDYISVAGNISDHLHKSNGGDDFATWVKRTVGNLKLTDDGREIVGEVCKLNSRVVTTNYDNLIEQFMPKWASYDWEQPDFATALNRSEVVVHLHGSAKNPRSIILGGADYQRLSGEYYDVLSQALFATRALIFIGCGSGLKDPHVDPVLKFLERHQEKTSVKHFILLTNEENSEFTANPLSSKISPVAYGNDHKDLLPFLRGLNTHDEPPVTETPEVNPPNVPGRTGTGFLFYAARAEEELNRAHDALRPVTQAWREVDDARAVPPGIDRRDPADQEDKHRKLAAGLTGPAARLDDYSQQILPRFRAAAEPAWQAVRLDVSGRPDRLIRIRGLAVGLETEAGQLLALIAEAAEDLERRITEYDPAYQEASDKISYGHTAIKRACAEITNLCTALDRHVLPEAAAPSAAPPDDPAPPPSSSAPPPPGPAPPADDDTTERPALRLARVIGQASGGFPTGIGVPGPDKIPVPPEYTYRGEVFALLVSGDSMSGDGIVDGDYVTVLRKEDCDDGDMVAAVFGGESDDAAVVKWLRRSEGGRLYLESSVPDDTAGLKRLGEFKVRGKVIGVVRWRIKRLSERPPKAGDDEHAD
jgi:hypothetical protein